jgi:hypothetical protein
MADQINKLNSNQQTLTRNIQNLANPRPNPPPRQQPVVPLKDFYDPSYYEERPGVVIPEGDFEIKPAVLNLIKHFHGLPREDPFSHLEELTLLAQTTRSRNVQEDIWLMRLFPLSLKDKAAYWFRTIGRPITTWPQLKSAFLKKFFPIGRTNSLRRSITTFHQKSGETFHDSWERFQDLLRSCPHHEIPLWQLVQIFYHGLEDQIRQFVDASCGGNFLNKDAESAYDLFEEMSENSFNQASMNTFCRTQNPQFGVHEIGTQSIPVTQDDLQLIAQKLDQMHINQKKIEERLATSTQAPHPHLTQPNFPRRENLHNLNTTPADYSEVAHDSLRNYNYPDLNPTQNISAIQEPFKNSSNWKNYPNYSWNNQVPPQQNQFNGYGSNPTFHPGPSQQDINAQMMKTL